MSETLSAIVSPARGARTQPALFIGLAGDAPRSPPARISLTGVDRVDIGRGDRRRIDRVRQDGADVVDLQLADGRVSTKHARVARVLGGWLLEDLGSKNGTWIGAKRAERNRLEDGDAILVGHTVLIFRTEGGEQPDQTSAPAAAPGLETLSPALAERFAALAQAARSLVPIEITGETGTGKELAARAVHALSGRSGRFVAVNCGGLPETLIEGELFGRRRGAYTGADDDRAGLIASASGGTLFLDEIAELPGASQASILRALQEGEVVPLGADRAVRVDLRVVSATHRDLGDEIAAGRFRADLRARLLGVAIELPPLRERLEDLASLVRSLLDRVAADREFTFSADAVSALYAHDWPLNIRELERALAAAAALATDRIEVAHLPATVGAPAPGGAAGPAVPVDLAALTPEDRELRDVLAGAIDRHAGNLAAVARELGKDRTQIRRWMRRFNLGRGPLDG